MLAGTPESALQLRITRPSARTKRSRMNSAFWTAMATQSSRSNAAPASAKARITNAFHEVITLSSVIGGTRLRRAAYSNLFASPIFDVNSSTDIPSSFATDSSGRCMLRMF